MLLFLLSVVGCSSDVELPDPSTYRTNTMDTMGDLDDIDMDEGEDEGPNKKPKIINLRISPQDVYGSTDVEVLFRAEDPEGLPVSTSFQWYVNQRKRLGRVSRGLKSRFFRKGDILEVVMKATDGKHTVETRSRPIEVLNSPPEMITKPGSLGSLDGVTIRAEDPDGDELRFYLEDSPKGLSIDPKRGVLRYVASENADVAGEFQTKIVAEDPDGARVVFPLTLQVTPGRSSAPAP